MLIIFYFKIFFLQLKEEVEYYERIKRGDFETIYYVLGCGFQIQNQQNTGDFMIISASRRTDIPAFYGEWFMKRIEEGYFYRINPFNSKQIKGFSLEPESVDVFVFWTKNPKPFMKYLDLLDDKGYHYYFQFTLNDYPTLFEPNVPKIDSGIETFIELSNRVGKERVIWRYDPIILSTITSLDYHIEKIEFLFNRLHKHTNRLTISFIDYYGKVEKRLKKLEDKHNIKFYDILDDLYKNELNQLTAKIVELSAKYNIEVVTCAEQIDLQDIGINHGSCIDGNLINLITQNNKEYKKDKNQRSECKCVESVDMGVYNTCSFGCIYCYANYSETAINNNKAKHNILSPALIGEHKKS